MHHRCNICDRTNVLEVTTLDEQYFRGPYFQDPHKPGELCQECLDVITNVVEEDEIDDFPYTFV